MQCRRLQWTIASPRRTAAIRPWLSWSSKTGSPGRSWRVRSSAKDVCATIRSTRQRRAFGG
eukprot:13602364-Alexandrium_andersonii.AAC.1